MVSFPLKYIFLYNKAIYFSGAQFFDSARNKTATGYIDISVTFKEALETNVTLIGFGITDDTLAIDGNRDIYINPPELSGTN